jgi:hypothetical protein
MAQPIVFLNKNKLDISNPNVTLTASEGQDYVDLVRNRSNTSAWVTTDSDDADLTNIVFDFGETRTLSEIILVKHNLKSYTIQYWNGATYVNFSTIIAPTANALDTTHHTFTQVETDKIKLVINGTMVADEDKYIFQVIATTRIGQFTGYPIISGFEIDRNRVINQMLSGKKSIIENIGGISFDLSVKFWNIVSDIGIVESLYDASEGFIVWVCGGQESQFFTPVKGYRVEDMILMKCANEYNPDFVKGCYLNGLDLKIKLAEVVD